MTIITDGSGRKLCVAYVCEECGARRLSHISQPASMHQQAAVCKECKARHGDSGTLRRELVDDADTILRDMMTEKQKQVVDLKEGMTRDEVCDEMGITIATLEGHEERIRKKRREAQQIADRV